MHTLHQTIDNQWALSKEGEVWWRPERRPNVPLAPLGEWGGGLIWPFRTLTLDRDVGSDEITMYYSGTEGIHGDMYSTKPSELFDSQKLGSDSRTWGYTDLRLKSGAGGSEQQYLSPVRTSIWFSGAMMAARWRHGRLWAVMPASGGAAPATLLSKPLNITAASCLVANLKAYRGGSAKAELVDLYGDAVRGFELDSSVPFAGDSPRVVMSWHTAADALRWFEGPRRPAQVQVRWELTRTLLYGFTLSLDCASSTTTPLRTDDAAATSPNLLSNADFAQPGSTEGEPASGWTREGSPGYSVAKGVRHGSSGASLEVHAPNTSALAGAVQVIAVPADAATPRMLRVSGWSRAVAVTGPASDGYAISCDLTFADGSHHYGVAVARFHTGSHDWQQAEASFSLPATGTKLASIAFYLLLRGHTGTAYFSDVTCTLESVAAQLQHHAIYSAYNAGLWTPDCPGGCPESNSFGRSNYTNVFFTPFLDIVTDNATLCPADFAPALQNGTCLPDPAAFAAGSKLVPEGRRALWMPSFPVAMCSVVRTRSSTIGECTRDAPCTPAMTQCFSNSTCGYWLDELADGFVGPWSEIWQSQSAARFDWWMGQYKQHGGTLDLLFMDAEDRPGPDELGWSYISGQRNGSGEQGSEAAIMADARWPALREQLGRLARTVDCPWPELSLVGWRDWFPSDCRALVWNEVAQNISAAALDAAIFTPTRKHFPTAQGSNFAHWHTDPLSPETWAFQGFQSLTHTGIGFGAHAGSHSSGSWYAEPAQTGSHHSEFGFDVAAQFVVALPDKRTSNNTNRAQPEPFCETADVTPYNQLIYDTRKARNIQTGNRKAEKPADGSIAWMAPKRGRVASTKDASCRHLRRFRSQPTVAATPGMDVIGKGYNASPGIYHDSDLYQEALYHIALSGCVQTFIYCACTASPSRPRCRLISVCGRSRLGGDAMGHRLGCDVWRAGRARRGDGCGRGGAFRRRAQRPQL